MLDLVRQRSGAAVASDFVSGVGSPIVIDQDTGDCYVITAAGVVTLAGTASFQPLDADLTAIAALGYSSTSFLKKTAANTWALDTTAYAPIASPTLTGTPAAPTATFATNTTQIATTAFVLGWASSGTYTPTLFNTTNVAASTAQVCQYMRVGLTVTVSGGFQLDPTSATTTTVLGISLPVASALALSYDCAGTAGNITPSPPDFGVITADTTNARATLTCYPSGALNNQWYFHFTYQIK